jgi:hypothetical protein
MTSDFPWSSAGQRGEFCDRAQMTCLAILAQGHGRENIDGDNDRTPIRALD